MWDAGYREELEKRREGALQGGGEKRIERQHAKGKLTARERIEYFFDRGSFTEINTLVEAQSGTDREHCPGDGVIVGYGTVNGRPVCVSSQDFTVTGGTLGEYHAKKICSIMDIALRLRIPYISINDSGGARIEEGIASLDGYGNIFYRNTKASGVIPQISVILGPCAGGACYSPAITDFIFMSRSSANMFITGPAVVSAVTGEETAAEELGGTEIHMRKSGVAHFSYEDDYRCLDGVKKLLSYLPDSHEAAPEKIFRAEKETDDSGRLEEIVPDNLRKAYDIKRVIEVIADRDTFFEVQKDFAANIVIGFVKINAGTVGIIASQPMHMGGALDIDASEKAARFVRFCDCFHIPILALVDVPGFMPGKQQEQGGIIRRGAKLLYAFAEASVPRVTLILRKAFGGAYIAMNSKCMGADFVFAWPVAQIAVMGAEGAAVIMYRKEIADSPHPEMEREKRQKEYEKHFMTPYIAAEKGYIDEVILPEETKRKIQDAFFMLKRKERDIPGECRHGNIPL